MTYTMLGKEFPMEYTVEVQDKLAKHFGGLTRLGEAIDAKSDTDKLKSFCFIAAAMMEGAENRERVECVLLGKEFTGAKAPTYDMLCQALRLTDLPSLLEAVFETMREGQATTVEVESNEKNVVTQ